MPARGKFLQQEFPCFSWHCQCFCHGMRTQWQKKIAALLMTALTTTLLAQATGGGGSAGSTSGSMSGGGTTGGGSTRTKTTGNPIQNPNSSTTIQRGAPGTPIQNTQPQAPNPPNPNVTQPVPMQPGFTNSRNNGLGMPYTTNGMLPMQTNLPAWQTNAAGAPTTPTTPP